MTDKNPIEDLREIRKMMESSSKFLSLSGLSGVFAGLTALVGSYVAYLQDLKFSKLYPYYYLQGRTEDFFEEQALRYVLCAGIILVVALSFGVFFTWLKARKHKQKLWTPLSMKLVISLMVPLFFGGLFLIGMFYQGLYYFIAPATLLIYGLSLLNASKYVHVELKYLALCEMGLGVLAIFKLDLGYMAWIVGFGVLHVLYGAIMYFKYDRN